MALRCMNGLDFNYDRYPCLAFKALVEVFPEVIQYEGIDGSVHYTEIELSDLMIELANIKEDDKIYDGAWYGLTAGLAAAGRNVALHLRDISVASSAVARALSLMIGKLDSVVQCGDTISDPRCWEEPPEYDHFLTHSPFGYSIQNEVGFKQIMDRDSLIHTTVKMTNGCL